MKSKKKEGGKEFKVYHIAIPHAEEIIKEVGPEVKKRFLSEIKLVFLECAQIPQREMKEKYCNEIAQGRAEPISINPAWRTIEEFIFNTKKKIHLEKMPEIIEKILQENNKTLKEITDFFYRKNYKEAGEKFRKSLKLLEKMNRIRDEEISRELDKIVEKEKGNILLLLGIEHRPSPKKAILIRWEPMKYIGSREILNLLQKSNPEDSEKILMRELALSLIAGYFQEMGKSTYGASKKFRPIINSIPISQLKGMFDFVIEGKREERSFRTIFWLKKHKLVSEEELK